MHEVGAAEALRPHERVAQTQPLDLGDGNDETDEREPGEAREHEQDGEERKRHIGEHAGPERPRGRTSPNGHAGHDPDGEHV